MSDPDVDELRDLRERCEELMSGLADALEVAGELRDALGRNSPARHAAVMVTHLQTAGLWLGVVHAELIGVQVADQVILDSLRGI